MGLKGHRVALFDELPRILPSCLGNQRIDVGDRQGQDFFAGSAYEAAACLVGVDDSALPVRPKHGVGSVIDRELREPKVFFGVLAFDQLRQGKISAAHSSRHAGHPLKAVAGLEPAQFNRTLHGSAQFQEADRLLEIITGPALERLCGNAEGRMPGQNDDLEVGVEILQRLHRLDSVHFRHEKIGKGYVELPALQQRHRVFTALRADHRMSFAPAG